MARVRMTMSTRNLSALSARFRAFDADYQQQAREVVVKAAVETFDHARRIMPYDTGFMHNSLRVRFSDKGLGYEVGWKEEEFTAAGLAFYPVYQEFGTRFMAAQPSLFPANAAVRPVFQRDLRAALDASIARSNRRRAA